MKKSSLSWNISTITYQNDPIVSDLLLTYKMLRMFVSYCVEQAKYNRFRSPAKSIIRRMVSCLWGSSGTQSLACNTINGIKQKITPGLKYDTIIAKMASTSLKLSISVRGARIMRFQRKSLNDARLLNPPRREIGLNIMK